MKKLFAALFNLVKLFFASLINLVKNIFAAIVNLVKIVGSGKRKKFIAILLLLIMIAAALVVFVSSRGEWPGKSSEEKKTEFVQKNEEEAETEDSNSGNLENHLGSDFIKTLKSGNYLIKYRTTTVYDGKPFEVEITYAVSGDRIAMVSEDRATIVKDNKVYMLNHTDKTMISWDVDHTSNDLKRIDTKGLVYLGSSKAGNLLCEEYKTELTNIKLYFDGRDLRKMATEMNRQDIVMEIVEVSEEIPESMFQVPTGYNTTNL